MTTEAACSGLTALFYSIVADDQARAVAICQTCPVLNLCAQMGANEPEGVWGGTTPKMRRKAKRPERAGRREAMRA